MSFQLKYNFILKQIRFHHFMALLHLEYFGKVYYSILKYSIFQKLSFSKIIDFSGNFKEIKLFFHIIWLNTDYNWTALLKARTDFQISVIKWAKNVCHIINQKFCRQILHGNSSRSLGGFEDSTSNKIKIDNKIKGSLLSWKQKYL